jgi:hypothetical protein
MPPTQIVNFLPPAYITNINNALTTKIIQNNSTITSATGYNATYIWNVTADEQVLTIQSGAANGSYIILQDPNYTWNSQTTGPAISFDSGATTGIVTIGNNASDLSSLVGSTIRFVYNSINNVWNSTIAPATTDNPLHGWWRNVAKGLLVSGATDAQASAEESLPSGYTSGADMNFYNVTYYYLDCISMYPQVKLTAYGGTYDSVFGALQFESVYDILEDGLTLAYPGVVGTSSFSSETYLELPDYIPNTLTLQSNGNQLFGTYGNITDPSFILSTTKDFNQYSSILQKMDTPPVIRPYSDNEVAFSDVQDPVNMFKYFAKVLSEKGMAQINLRQALDEWYLGYYTQQSILQSYLDGKTEYYDVHHIVKSTTTQYTPADAYTGGAGYFGYGSLTGATKIFLGKNHLVTKGSIISITGCSGEWIVLNNDYANDVIYDTHFNTQSTGHFDCNQSEIVANLTGSLYNTINYFVLRLDTSSLTGINEEAYNGWATDYGTPVVSVTHHIRSDMSYSEFIGALKAYVLEVYGTQEHTYLNVLLNEDESGKIADDWESFSAYFASYDFQGWALGQGYSLYYNSSYSPDYNVIYGDHYDITNTLLTYVTGAATGGFSISALNYLDPNETYNLYYAFDGEFATGDAGSVLEACGQIQEYYGNLTKAMNLSVAGLTGGSLLVYTGAQYYGYTGADIDRTKWNIMGSVNTSNGDEASAYNFFIYGLIQSALTPGKKIGYIYSSLSYPFVDGVDQTWYYDNTWANKDVLQNAPDKWANGVYAVNMIPVMQYFNSQQVDGIILDNRGNAGGYEGWFEQFFGGDRLRISDKYFYLNSQNGLSTTLNIETPFQYYQNLNTTGSDNYLHPSFLESAQGYGTGCVYHGTPQTGANIVFLQSESAYSAGNLRLWNMLGDNLDGDIGEYTTVKVLGCSKGYFASFGGDGYYIPAPYIADSVRGNPFYYTAVNPEGTCPSIKLSSGASEPVLTPTNQITDKTAISPMTSITGAYINSLGNPFPMGFEENVYPDLGYATNNRLRLPGDSRPQQPDPTVSGTWRDGWLEASIGEIVYGTW